MTSKEYNEAKSRLDEIKRSYEETQGKLAKENRSMTKEEEAQMKANAAEEQRLKLACRSYQLQREIERSKSLDERRSEENSNVAFAQAIRSIISGHGVPAGLEMLRSVDGGFEIPYSAAAAQFRAATIQTNATVSPITPVYIKDYIKELEPATILGQLGLHIQSGIEGQWNYPTIKGEDCDWLGENDEGKGINVTLGVKTITPHRLPCRVDISNRALNTTGGEIRNIMVETMKSKHSLRLNKTFVSNTNPSNTNAPIGPHVNISSDNTIAAGAITALKRENFINIRSAVNKQNVPVNNPAYLINWDTWAQLVNTPYDKAGTRYLLDPQSGTIDGVKVVVSNLIPDGVIYYGNYGYSMIGQFGPMTMTVDSTSIAVASTAVTSIVINSEWDFFTPYQEAFGKITYTTA